MVQKGRRMGYSLGLMKKEKLLFKIYAQCILKDVKQTVLVSIQLMDTKTY